MGSGRFLIFRTGNGIQKGRKTRRPLYWSLKTRFLLPCLLVVIDKCVSLLTPATYDGRCQTLCAAVDSFVVKSVLPCRGLQIGILREESNLTFLLPKSYSSETEETANWQNDETDGFISVLQLFTLRSVGLRFPPKGVFLSPFSFCFSVNMLRSHVSGRCR